MDLLFGRSLGLIGSMMVCGLFTDLPIIPAAHAQANRLVQDHVRELNRQIAVESTGAAVNRLLQERARLLAELMEHNPGAAIEAALPNDVRQTIVSRHPEFQAWIEEKGAWTGLLFIAIAEDSRHRRSKTIQTLRIEGRPVRLYWDSPLDAACARFATVQGIRLGDRIAAASVLVTADATSPCSTTGDQKTAVLMINYKSHSITPGYTADFLRNSFFGPAPSLTDYWQEASYGVASASGDVFGPFNLDVDFACDQQEEILQAAIAVADSTVDFTAYQRIFLILPVTVDGGCTYDGLAQVGCWPQQSPSKGAFTASVTWLETPTLGANIYGILGEFVQTVIHEGGHNFGLRHANTVDYDTLPIGALGADGVHVEYGDPFSSMGGNPGHFAAPHMSILGWLNEGAGYQSVQAAGSWTLAPLSLNTSSLHALRVQRGTGNGQWLWIEYRQPIGPYEPAILDTTTPRDFNGVLVHLEDPAQLVSWPAYSELLSFQPVRVPNDFNQALLKANTTWSDPYSNLTLSTGSATPSGIAVTVSYDSGCATLSAASQSFSPLAGSGQINVQASAACSWSAVSGAEWIALTGGQSGTGPGTMSYSVLANSSASTRSSFISITHQTFAISQDAQPQGGSVAVAPASGSGPSQTFSFQFSDPTSRNNLTWGEVNINAAQMAANSCYIHWQAAGNLLSLRDDADATWLGPVAVGAAGTLANGQCVLHPETATLSGAGASATLNLNVEFTNRFANSQKNVYMQSQSVATACGWQEPGTWVVSFPFNPVSVTPASGSGTHDAFAFTMSGFYPVSSYYEGDEADLAFTTSSAFGTLQFYDHGCAFAFGPSLASIFLYGDAISTDPGASGTLGSGQPLENSQCSLNLAASSAQLSGNTLTLRLAITFTREFSGQKDIYVFGPGSGWPLGASLDPVGKFTVAECQGRIKRGPMARSDTEPVQDCN